MKYFCKLCDITLFIYGFGDCQKQVSDHLKSKQHEDKLAELKETLNIDKNLFKGRLEG